MRSERFLSIMKYRHIVRINKLTTSFQGAMLHNYAAYRRSHADFTIRSLNIQRIIITSKICFLVGRRYINGVTVFYVLTYKDINIHSQSTYRTHLVICAVKTDIQCTRTFILLQNVQACGYLITLFSHVCTLLLTSRNRYQWMFWLHCILPYYYIIY